MHALTFSRFGGPEVLEWSELPNPRAAPGTAVVRTRAIGVNFADIYRREGRYHLAGAPPWIAGYEASGEIEALHEADAHRGIRIGQRVAFADSPFANAEQVAVSLERLIRLPDDIDHETAAAVLLQGLTAQFLVEDSHAVQAGGGRTAACRGRRRRPDAGAARARQRRTGDRPRVVAGQAQRRARGRCQRRSRLG